MVKRAILLAGFISEHKEFKDMSAYAQSEKALAPYGMGTCQWGGIYYYVLLHYR